MFKITNNVEDKVLLDTTNRFEFINFVQMIFMENGDSPYMQKPESVMGCKRYIEEYCDNLDIEIS